MSIESVGEFRKVLSLMVMGKMELIQSLYSVGNLLPNQGAILHGGAANACVLGYRPITGRAAERAVLDCDVVGIDKDRRVPKIDAAQARRQPE